MQAPAAESPPRREGDGGRHRGDGAVEGGVSRRPVEAAGESVVRSGVLRLPDGGGAPRCPVGLDGARRGPAKESSPAPVHPLAVHLRLSTRACPQSLAVSDGARWGSGRRRVPAPGGGSGGVCGVLRRPESPLAGGFCRKMHFFYRKICRFDFSRYLCTTIQWWIHLRVRIHASHA